MEMLFHTEIENCGYLDDDHHEGAFGYNYDSSLVIEESTCKKGDEAQMVV